MLILRQGGAAAAASAVDRQAPTVARRLSGEIGGHNYRSPQSPRKPRAIRPLWVFTALTSVKPVTFSIGYKHEAKGKLGDIS
jgi:hypothetical protein